jgi:molybdopterin-guanine dinucleotide biosynthesis protein A
MGIPKALLPFGPERMIDRVIRLLGEIVDPIVVVAAPRQELPDLPAGVMLARDRVEAGGPLEALYAGLAAVAGRADAAYVMGCDTPLLTAGFVRRMVELLADHQIAVPREDRFFHPLAAVYRTDLLPQVEALLAEHRTRPFFLYDRADTREVPVAELRDVDPELLTLENLNTPQEYLRALERAGFEAPAEILGELADGERREEARPERE